MDCDKTSVLNICRICLSSEGNIYSMSKYKLKNTFEHITGISLQEDNSLPQTLCTECAQRLKNCGQLRQKSIRANTILSELARKYEYLTLPIIRKVNRSTNRLNSSLDTKMFAPDHYDFNVVSHLMEVKVEHEVFANKNYEYYHDENLYERHQGESEGAISDHENNDFLGSDEDMPMQQIQSKIPENLTQGQGSENQQVVMLERIIVKTEKDEDIDTDERDLEASSDKIQELPDMQIASTSFGHKNDNKRKLDVEIEILKIESQVDTDDWKTDVPTAEMQEELKVKEELLTELMKTDITEVMTTNLEEDLVTTLKPKTVDEINKNENCEIKNKSTDKSIRDSFIQNDGIYACSVCDKKYKVKGFLYTHLKTHSGVGLHECDVCKRLFARKCDLQNHSRAHKNPFKCEICGSRYADDSTLKIHLKSHGEKLIPCNVCGRMFTNTGRLKLHIRMIHTGDLPYTCEICGAKRISGYSLIQHLRVHTGVRPFVCNVCGKSFTFLYALEVHAKLHVPPSHMEDVRQNEM